MLPLARKLIYLVTSPSLAPTRKRALGITAITCVVAIGLIGFLPLPQSTNAEGVLWLPDDARVRAESQGFVRQLFSRDGDTVSQGQVLMQLDNPELDAELNIQQAALAEFTARYQQAWSSERRLAVTFIEDIDAIKAEIALLQRRLDGLIVRSPSQGIFRLQLDAPDGRFIAQGEQVAVIEKNTRTRVRVALTQDEIGQVRQDSQNIEVKLAQQLGKTHRAQLGEQVPAATTTLPSAVLGASGGGRLSLDNSDPEGLKTQQLIFLLDIYLPEKKVPGGRCSAAKQPAFFTTLRATRVHTLSTFTGISGHSDLPTTAAIIFTARQPLSLLFN